MMSCTRERLFDGGYRFGPIELGFVLGVRDAKVVSERNSHPGVCEL